MWIKVLFLFIVSSTLGTENNIKFTLDYFKHRGVKFVCLFTCEDGGDWSHNFVKNASSQAIATSKVKADDRLENFSAVAKCLSQEFTPIGVLIDSQCPKFEEILQFASANTFFDSMHKWFIVQDEYQAINVKNDTDMQFDANNKTVNDSSITDILDKVKTSVNSDIIVCLQTDLFKYDLFETFNFGKEQGENLTVIKVGYWNDERGLVLNRDLNSYKYYRRWNFKQWPMKMIAVVSNPPKYFDPELIGGRNQVPGVAVITQTSATILHVVAEMHNFRYNYTIAERWIGDFKSKDSKVVADSLYFRFHDISPVIRFMPSIYEKIDIVHPALTSIETRYYYRIPTYGAGKLENQFLRPLTSGAWIAVFIVVSLCALMLLESAKLELRPSPGQYAVFSVVASFCQQFFEDCGDTGNARTSLARKITVFVTGLSCLLIYNYYTSSVVSWLLNGPPPSINSLEELLESPLELIFEDIGYTRSWLQTPSYFYNKRNAKVENEIRQKKIFSKKKEAPLLMDVNDGIEMVKAGGYAYHTEVNTANILISQKFTQTELCELGSLQSMEKTMLYPAVQKNSPYKEFFIWSLARLAERGIVSCIQHRTGSPTVACEGSSPRALALGGAAPAFLLLAFGYLLATVICVLERLISRRFGVRMVENITPKAPLSF